MKNAIIPAGARCFRDKDGAIVYFAHDIKVYAKILLNDIEVTEFRYKGLWYTVDTAFVKWI